MNLHWVDSPDDEGEATDGSEEVANLTTLGGSSGAAMDNELPDDNQVGNAGNGVPSPLLWSSLRAESSEETGQDHDQVSNDGNQDGSAVQTSKETKIQEEQRSGNGPVNVTCPIDLAVDVVLGVWDVLVRVADNNVVVANAVASGHGEVRERRSDRDQGGHNVVQALGLHGCQLVACLWARHKHTIGTFHARPLKTIEATSMTTKTTLCSR